MKKLNFTMQNRYTNITLHDTNIVSKSFQR